MLSRLLLLITLLLQITPQIHWTSEVQATPDGNRLVLTGELDEGIDHVSGTVTYMPCKGDACYMPVDWDFEAFIEATTGKGATSGYRSGVSAVPAGNRATLGSVRGRGPLP